VVGVVVVIVMGKGGGSEASRSKLVKYYRGGDSPNPLPLT